MKLFVNCDEYNFMSSVFLSFVNMTHKKVVIEEIMDMLDAAKSGVVPGSVSQAVVSGIQNVPSQIIQPRVGGGSSTAYTTFPLSPIVKTCCIDKSYLNLEFDINFTMKVSAASAMTANAKVPFYLGFRDNASIFNQLQIMIENTALWTTTYQREESVLSYNSLPETEIRGNNQYASIEKIREGRYSPMKRLVLTFDLSKTVEQIQQVNLHFKGTVDLNRLTPLLSNLHFTTDQMGNLRLKVFIQEIEKALLFCPDYNFFTNKTTSAGSITAAVLSPLLHSAQANQYWQFYSFNEFFGVNADGSKKITSANIPFYAYDTNGTPGLLAEVIFDQPDGKPFMSFQDGIAEIVQTVFDIRDEEYRQLSDHFAALGSVIIPTQTWSSQVFNNSMIKNGAGYPTTQIGNVGGYNIDFISVWHHSDLAPTCLNKEFLRGIQMQLDGRNINAIPYDFVNDRCVVDMTQAIIDTDHEEINHDYIASLTCFNENDRNTYTDAPFSSIYGNGDLSHSMFKNYVSNPNTFALNFSTNLPDAFHSGACVLENSNRQAVIRFIANSSETDNAKLQGDRKKFPLIPTHFTQANTIVGFSCFCDCCLVLTFDPDRNRCYDGQLSWAAPYA